jgi:hypothetical protein
VFLFFNVVIYYTLLIYRANASIASKNKHKQRQKEKDRALVYKKKHVYQLQSGNSEQEP